MGEKKGLFSPFTTPPVQNPAILLMLALPASNLFHVGSNHANDHLVHFTGQETEAQGI